MDNKPIRQEPQTVNDVVELLIKSKIVTDEQAKELLSQYQEQKESSESIAEFCEFVVGNGSVTAWQCDKLKTGRWKGFYFHHFLLLYQVGKGTKTATYRARDPKDNSLVNLIITPIGLSKGPENDYRAEHDLTSLGE